MPDTFLLQILVKKGVCADARLGEAGVRSWKQFLVECQVQLRIPLSGFGNHITGGPKFLSLQLNFFDF